ncbi:hypothetical protein DAT35_38045 [Vitiosangium sp. GDMCC 1.1324]|nr:hypothetical protein DAT35_38045 [Vitiosangium sp. GDMCC 1.1324]
MAPEAAEFIISDDGSRDEDARRYVELVEAGLARFSEAGVPHRLRCVRAPRNQGKGAAIRRAWSNTSAGTDWLAFLDADGAVPGREFWRLGADAVRARPVRCPGGLSREDGRAEHRPEAVPPHRKMNFQFLKLRWNK